MSHSIDCCPVCQKAGVEIFFNLPAQPVFANVLLSSREDARCVPRGDLRLGFCPTCGHIFNTAFDPALVEYTPDYENSLHFSPHFQRYAEELARDLVDRYDLRQKELVEIGAGNGDFLAMLARLGKNRATGYDPSFRGGDGGEVSIVREYYGEHQQARPADFVIARHVLEHIQRPREFVDVIGRTASEQPVTVFFEVPNARFILDQLSIWDLIYEHVSYFSAESLGWLFGAAGFQVLDLRERYAGQFLTIEACLPASEDLITVKPDLSELREAVSQFVSRFDDKMAYYGELLADLRAQGRRAVVWGAGSKGVTFLNLLPEENGVAYIVDINPRKHGKFTAGSGVEIIPPAWLPEVRPDVVVVMNPVYQDEITDQLAELGVSAELLAA